MSEVNQDLSDVLTANYLIASIHVRTWSARKTDKDAGDELTASKGAASDAASVIKSLLVGNDKELKDAKSAYNRLRTFFYAATLPWGSADAGRGDGMIGVQDSFKFMAEFARLKAEAEVARDALVAMLDVNRPALIASARQRLGSLYKDTDYPSADEVKGMFGASMTIRPMPATSDFSRAAIPAALVTGLQKRYERQAASQVDNAVVDLRDRLTGALERMHAQLSKVVNGESPRLFKSLLTNLEQMTGLAESLAPVSPELGALASKIKSELLAHEIDAFKDNVTLSRSVASKASTIIAELGLPMSAREPTMTAHPDPAASEAADEMMAAAGEILRIVDTKQDMDLDQIELPDIEDLL